MPYTFSACIDDACTATVDDAPDIDMLGDLGQGFLPGLTAGGATGGVGPASAGSPTNILPVGTVVHRGVPGGLTVGSPVTLLNTPGFRLTSGAVSTIPGTPNFRAITNTYGVLTSEGAYASRTIGRFRPGSSPRLPAGTSVKVAAGSVMFPVPHFPGAPVRVG